MPTSLRSTPPKGRAAEQEKDQKSADSMVEKLRGAEKVAHRKNAAVGLGAFAAVLPTTGTDQLPQGEFRKRKIPELKKQNRKLVLHWNKRQMETRGIERAAITGVRDAVREG